MGEEAGTGNLRSGWWGGGGGRERRRCLVESVSQEGTKEGERRGEIFEGNLGGMIR